MPDKLDIEKLVRRYIGYWEQSDIESLMSMYDENMSYHDMPSGDVIKYPELKQFLTKIFTVEKDQQFKLKEFVSIEGNTAFIYWLQSFSVAKTGKNIKVNGVELIVFHQDKIISIHEFYDYRVFAIEEIDNETEGSHVEKMTKLGLDNELMQKIAEETIHYFDEQKPYLEPDLNLTIVSKNLGYTRNQISYVINHVLEKTFYDLLNGRRIDYVIKQMSTIDSNNSILEMAINAGFNSVSGFYSAFKKHTGMTPAQYQRTQSN